MVYKYFKKGVVGWNVHATIPTGNMGYDQYIVPNDCSCRTYFCCFPLALANIRPWPSVPNFKFLWKTVNSKPPTIPFVIVACTFSDNLSRNSCIRVHLPWVNFYANEQKCKQWRHDESGGKKLTHQKVTYEKTVNSNSYCINYACSTVSVFRLRTISKEKWNKNEDWRVLSTL